MHKKGPVASFNGRLIDTTGEDTREKRLIGLHSTAVAPISTYNPNKLRPSPTVGIEVSVRSTICLQLLDLFLYYHQPKSSQRMKAQPLMELQLNTEQLPIMISLPSTPPKQRSPFGSFNHTELPSQMMFVETPVKQEQKFIDTLLQSEHSNHQCFGREQIPLMQQQISEYIFQNEESEDLENREPNIQRPSLRSSNHLKPPHKIEEENQVSNPTFKTPGRSQRSNAQSTTNKKKPCTCKKSGCLKKYCECFKAGEICNENCDCIGCKNHNPDQLKTVSQSSCKSTQQIMCNCKKSHCLKGYCDCHAAGATCSELCNCVECKNTAFTPSQFALTHTSKRSKRVHWSEIEEGMEEEAN